MEAIKVESLRQGEMNREQLQQKSVRLTQLLLEEMKPEGFWTGELSSSALGVAVSVAALHFHDPESHNSAIQSGLRWLCQHVNNDGSFGDTTDSPGNVSTSLLVYACLNLYAKKDDEVHRLQHKISRWLAVQDIDVQSAEVSRYIISHYQNDYTFSVPILTLCGLCGVPGPGAFRFVPQLPYELVLFPRKFYRFLNLSVVSYAIPALVSVGIIVFKKKKSNWLWRLIRRFSIRPALNKLEKMMPESGGFLEAIPLTAFVALSLTEAGFRDHPIVVKGISFLKKTQRTDGSWPIDVDLSTWVTTLSVKALGANSHQALSPVQRETIVTHLLKCQNTEVHRFNGSNPGGWGWTNFPGSVPDGDDTPGVILTLLQLSEEEYVFKTVIRACLWLHDLQNSDGGFSTFTKGWGKLPFDRSSCDLTGHCILAMAVVLSRCCPVLRPEEKLKIKAMLFKATCYLQEHQQADGSWLPLWFGNQHTSDHANPVYGTARVLTYLQDVIAQTSLCSSGILEKFAAMISKASHYLHNVQNPDGSWGGALNVSGSIEETALAISALSIDKSFLDSCLQGMTWLDQNEQLFGLQASPIGLYFASLWYCEKLYPLTSYLEAATRLLDSDVE